MINWDDVEGLYWDDGNERTSTDKHSVTQSEAEQVFLNAPLLVVQDFMHSQSEPPYHALGKTEQGRLLQITFTLRFQRTRIRIISARPMSRKERIIYAQAT